MRWCCLPGAQLSPLTSHAVLEVLSLLSVGSLFPGSCVFYSLGLLAQSGVACPSVLSVKEYLGGKFSFFLTLTFNW